jgi:LacI family transcriptional regulator
MGVRGIATVPQVAQRAGVSTATAARALGGYGSVRESTRVRVLAAAEELGYRPNSLARSMITGSSRTLGVLMSDIENPFFRRSLRGIADTARDSGFELLLANTDEEFESERSAVAVMAERRVDGLIVCPAETGDRLHLSTVISSGIPVVLLDRKLAGLKADTVGIDNRRAARRATQILLDQGHHRIAILTGGHEEILERLLRPDMRGIERLSATTVGSRAAGYRDALAEAGLPLRHEYLSANGFRREDALAETRRLMALPEPPTAILAFDSIQSLGALEAFASLGLDCPAQVSLLGFDDAEWADVVRPPLTVISQPAYQIGVAACERLLARIAGDNRPPEHQRLPVEVIMRSSVAPPPSGG